jgi:hypothetical protein
VIAYPHPTCSVLLVVGHGLDRPQRRTRDGHRVTPVGEIARLTVAVIWCAQLVAEATALLA